MKYIFNSIHYPVLLNESINALNIKNKRSNGIYVDCTFGTGGHCNKILNYLSKNGKLIAFDEDPLSIFFSKKIMDSRFTIFHNNFSNLDKILSSNNISSVNGILMDLGISSIQINDPKRGFSFNINSPLDMRINNTQGISASKWLSNAHENSIFNVIKKYGDKKYALKITKQIILFRKVKPILTTYNLLEIIKKSIYGKYNIKKVFARVFQAIRIFINNELENLKKGLNAAFNKISINGRLVVISFHSLEDKIVKYFMKSKTNINQFDNYIPILNINLPQSKVKIFPKVKPTRFEIFSNSRSRSAIMRYIERIY